MSAEVFFARAFRLFNYRGAMREALLAEQHDNGAPAAAARPVEPARPVAAGGAQPSGVDADGTEWVSLDDMRTKFPDLF